MSEHPHLVRMGVLETRGAFDDENFVQCVFLLPLWATSAVWVLAQTVALRLSSGWDKLSGPCFECVSKESRLFPAWQDPGEET